MLIPTSLLEHFIVFACLSVFRRFFYCVLIPVRFPSIPRIIPLFTNLLVPSLILGYRPTIPINPFANFSILVFLKYCIIKTLQFYLSSIDLILNNIYCAQIQPTPPPPMIWNIYWKNQPLFLVFVYAPLQDVILPLVLGDLLCNILTFHFPVVSNPFIFVKLKLRLSLCPQLILWHIHTPLLHKS